MHNRIRKPLACSLTLALLCLVAPGVRAQWIPLNPVVQVSQDSSGLACQMGSGILRIQVHSPSIVRVLYTADSLLPERPLTLLAASGRPHVKFKLARTKDEVLLTTGSLRVAVAGADGAITFSDSSGKKLFTDNTRTLTPATVNGEKVYHAEMFSNLWGSSEAFYGLGQHQAGVWNYRGEAVDISQDNTNISIPLVLSSYGYGIFWNAMCRSRFNNRFLNALYVSSEAADAVDYFFIYGPEMDSVVAGYRMLTGDVPLFGKWAYGFWQCKNRYRTQAEILSVARKYRELHIPLDNIVQDWFWWYIMGEPVFDKSRYPEPKGMIDTLHANHIHVMFSFWPYFRPGSSTYTEMDRRGYFVDKVKVAGFHPAGQALYDAFDPQARANYWQLLDSSLFRIGADAWWLDTTEPETEGREANILTTNAVAAGNGARYANLYPVMTVKGVYDGQRTVTDKKRVFILSRSAYAGSQRYATAVWSGDINSDWVFLKKQIPAGLNYSLSGMPYWTTDIGGFLSGDPTDPGYRELFVRWFQFGTFCPIFRVHGTRSPDENELWSYGAEAQKILVQYDRLRYRMLPYIYSLAWMTTHERYTPMRPLVMDFRTDTRAANIGDQFMFGPALLVNPVTEPAANSKQLYLPKGRWFDFWEGELVEGGKAIVAPAALDHLPLYARAGSIIPFGPDIEWSDQKPADPIELRIYPGADGSFTLYEDENDSYDYEKGAYATIRFDWNDAARTLTIGPRSGNFPGMLKNRTFRLLLVGKNHGTGVTASPRPDRVVTYGGRELLVTLKAR